jgi:hypothetical protein
VDIVYDDPDTGAPGWSSVMDLTRAPSEWLPWLAQLAGKRVNPSLDDDAQRARIVSTDGLDRGKLKAIAGAAAQSLDEPKTVFVVERHGGAYRLTVSTMTAQTPDPDRTRRDILEQKPGGLVLNTSSITGDDYLSLRDTHQSYQALLDVYTDYDGILSNPIEQ